jgi:hypothetical protein
MSDNSAEQTAWEEVKLLNTLGALDSFLIEFPDTKKKSEIASKREGIYYRIAVFENTEFYYNLYKKEFPQGKRIKEIEIKLEALSKEIADLDECENKTFIGSLKSDFNKPQKEILSIIFKKIESSENVKKFEASVFLTSDIKKDIKGTINANGHYYNFEESEDDEFIIGLGASRLYSRKNSTFLESVGGNDNQYWKVVLTEK